MDKKPYEKRGYLEEDYRIFYLEDLVSKEIEYQATYGTLPTAEKHGYNFDGWWDTGSTNIIYNIPPQYQELEYIESNGAQYIDTGFIPNKIFYKQKNAEISVFFMLIYAVTTSFAISLTCFSVKVCS